MLPHSIPARVDLYSYLANGYPFSPIICHPLGITISLFPFHVKGGGQFWIAEND